MVRRMRCPSRMRKADCRIVYILRSHIIPTERYIGRTSDMKARLEWHNHGPSGYTLRARPWYPAVVIEFCDEPTAIYFEKYLKSGSGRAFAKRHFAPATQPHIDSRYASLWMARS